MQNVISEVRGKLGQFVGGGEPPPNIHNEPEREVGRFIKRIPNRNYGELSRYVPISWL